MKKSVLLLNIAFFALLNLLFFSTANAQFVNAVVSLTGSVTDATTKKPVAVKLVIFDDTNKKVNTTKTNLNDNGSYYITGLKPGKKYFLAISQDGYLYDKYEIEIPNTDKYTEISRDFLAVPLVNGAKVAVSVPPFELNKSKLRFGAEDILANIKNSLRDNPMVNFEIDCFPDNNNNAEDNKKLTEERAQSLKSFFVSNGIDAARITVAGSEKTDPQNPPPVQKRAKGKRYIGSTYIVLKKG